MEGAFVEDLSFSPPLGLSPSKLSLKGTLALDLHAAACAALSGIYICIPVEAEGTGKCMSGRFFTPKNTSF